MRGPGPAVQVTMLLDTGIGDVFISEETASTLCCQRFEVNHSVNTAIIGTDSPIHDLQLDCTFEK